MPENNMVQDQIRMIRRRYNNERPRFRDEIRIIPNWVFFGVLFLFVVAQLVVQIANTRHRIFDELSYGLSALAVAGSITAGSLIVAGFIFLIAYINRDAARRQMSPTLWTLIAIFIPYLIGIFIYFLLREPLPSKCPECGKLVSPRFNFCPSCRCNLQPTCPQCKQELSQSGQYCPHCGFEVLPKAQAKSQGTPAEA